MKKREPTLLPKAAAASEKTETSTISKEQLIQDLRDKAAKLFALSESLKQVAGREEAADTAHKKANECISKANELEGSIKSSDASAATGSPQEAVEEAVPAPIIEATGEPQITSIPDSSSAVIFTSAAATEDETAASAVDDERDYIIIGSYVFVSGDLSKIDLLDGTS